MKPSRRGGFVYDIVEGIHKAFHIESLWGFVLVIALGTGAVGGFLAWVIDTGYRNSPEYLQLKANGGSSNTASKEDIQLSIVCEAVHLPVAQRGDLWFLNTVVFTGMAKLSPPSDKGEWLWPEEEITGLGYKCTIKNYGSKTAFGVSLLINVEKYGLVHESDGSWHSQAVAKESKGFFLNVPQPLSQNSGDQFSFYVCSYDADTLLKVLLPLTASVNSDDPKNKQDLPVRISSQMGNPFSVSPKMVHYQIGKSKQRQ